MLALKSELTKWTDQAEQLLVDSINQKLLLTLFHFSGLLKKQGLEVPPYSRKSLVQLESLPIEKKQQIIAAFEQWAVWVQNSQTEPSIQGKFDRKSLQTVLDYYGLRVSDRFWETLDSEQLIEIYGKDMIQLYRNLNFFKYCGYSLLDLSAFEWFLLWERPRLINEKMGTFAQRALSERIELENFSVPKHVLRETYDTGLTQPFAPRAILIEFLNIASLTRSELGPPAGFICTSRASIIAEGDEAYQIQFV